MVAPCGLPRLLRPSAWRLRCGPAGAVRLGCRRTGLRPALADLRRATRRDSFGGGAVVLVPLVRAGLSVVPPGRGGGAVRPGPGAPAFGVRGAADRGGQP